MSYLVVRYGIGLVIVGLVWLVGVPARRRRVRETREFFERDAAKPDAGLPPEDGPGAG